MKTLPVEHRTKQRIQATLPGQPGFWLSFEGQKLQVIDVSMGGFSFAAANQPETGHPFDFTLTWDGGSGMVKGRANIVNYLGGTGGGQAGCRILSLTDDSRTQLEAWLSTHVMASAAIPINPKEARAIVNGPSLV